MDQIKIGKFIASCRKERGMTQANLAEKLRISDRAISKWETGKSMPDSGIMLELCDL
ncbi:helix-turn-helix transcriptional regulator, partial [Limosilactobacillus fermentum]